MYLACTNTEWYWGWWVGRVGEGKMGKESGLGDNGWKMGGGDDGEEEWGGVNG